VVNDSIEKLIQLENGCDFLRRPLQRDQYIDAALL
jgi:hypothetical protein